LADVLWRAVDSIAASLSPDTVRGYRAVTRSFLRYLGAEHHEIRSLKQLRRDPHILGWLAHLRSRTPPIVLDTHVNNVVRLRHILEELAWNEQMPDLAHLLRHDDSPRRERKIPRPLTAEHDQLLQQELARRNDLASNALLLLRHTGMRIGECVDLSSDCLHAGPPGEWAIHVPLGKMKTERLVPVDSFVCQLVLRLRFWRSLYPTPTDGAIHQEAEDQGNERIVGAGRVHKQRNPRGPYVLSSVCRAAHESPIDPDRWSGGNRRTNRRIRRCAYQCGESAERRYHLDRCGEGAPAAGGDPARR